MGDQAWVGDRVEGLQRSFCCGGGLGEYLVHDSLLLEEPPYSVLGEVARSSLILGDTPLDERRITEGLRLMLNLLGLGLEVEEVVDCCISKLLLEWLLFSLLL